MVLLINAAEVGDELTKKFEHSYLSGKMDCRRIGRRSIAEVTEILNNEVFLKTKFKPFEYSVKLCNRQGKANLLLEFVKTNAHDPISIYRVLYKNTHERATTLNITQKIQFEKYGLPELQS